LTEQSLRPKKSAPRKSTELAPDEISRVIEMAWEDRTTFESILFQFGLVESDVIALMRREMQPSSFRMWRKRVTGRSTKHAQLRSDEVTRHRANNRRHQGA
jgi:uncharacterized protein (TIGR03643 family)